MTRTEVYKISQDPTHPDRWVCGMCVGPHRSVATRCRVTRKELRGRCRGNDVCVHLRKIEALQRAIAKGAT